MKQEREEQLSLACRFVLWLDDELEPTNRQTLLEDLADFGMFAEEVREKAREWLSSHPIQAED